MNERQAVAVNLLAGVAGILAVVLEPGLQAILAPLRPSPTLLGVGLLSVGVVVVGARAERRVGRTGATALLTVVAVTTVLAAGYAVSGLAGVQVTILLGMVGLVGVSAVRLVRTVSGAAPSQEA
jgi:hypothetical protein